MKNGKVWRLTLIFVLTAGAPLWSQPGAEDLQRASEDLQALTEELGRFVADTRFNEEDVQSFIRHWDSFSAIEDPEDEDRDFGDWLREHGGLDGVLKEPSYRAWATAKAVDADDWLHKSMRILAVVMRDQMQRHFAMVDQQFPRQMAMIEGQCQQIGEEACREMKQAMAASQEMVKSSKQALTSLPEPTSSEASLLAQYGREIAQLMEGDSQGDPMP